MTFPRFTFNRMVGMVVPHPRSPARFEIRVHVDRWHSARLAIVDSYDEAESLCGYLNPPLDAAVKGKA